MIVLIMWKNNYPLYDSVSDFGEHATQSVDRSTSKKEESNSFVDSAPEPQEETTGKTINDQYSENNHKEQTRGKMASVFISGFFMIIFMCFVYAGWKQAEISELQDMIIAVIGALSGLIGFVIGYYFKTKD